MRANNTTLVVDRALARRLERAEARAGAGFVEARARALPASGAEWIEVAGAFAMFDGADSPMTQTFGLGMFDPVTSAEMERLEAFYRERGAPVDHEVCPLADKSLLALLCERCYSPIEFTSVMFRELREQHAEAPPAHDIVARVADNHERELWARTAAAGWSDSINLGDQLENLMSIAASRNACISFLAERNGEAIAAGALDVEDDIALLAGASTVPRARNLGAQTALLDARLRYAVQAGCGLAMICTEPGSASQRNAERNGFRIAYTRIKWRLAKLPEP